MSRETGLLGCALMIWGLGEGVYVFFQPLYMQQLGASPAFIGFVFSAYGLISVFTHIISGYLADRIGRRPLIVAAFAFDLTASALMWLAGNLAVFSLAMMLYAATWCVSSPLSSYLTNVHGQWSLGRALTFTSAGFNLGLAIGPALGGWLGELYGLRSTFMFGSMIIAIGVVVVRFLPSQPVVPRPTNGLGGLPVLPGRFIIYLAIVFLAAFGAYLPQPLSSNFLQDCQHYSLPIIGRITSLAGLGTVVLNLGLGLLDARLALICSQAAVALFTVCLWRGDSVFWIAFGYFLMGGYKTIRSLAAAQVRSVVDDANLGLAYGITEAVMSTAVMLSPLLAAALYMRQPVSMYFTGFIMLIVSTVASALFTYGRHNPAVVKASFE